MAKVAVTSVVSGEPLGPGQARPLALAALLLWKVRPPLSNLQGRQEDDQGAQASLYLWSVHTWAPLATEKRTPRRPHLLSDAGTGDHGEAHCTQPEGSEQTQG